MKEWKSKIMNSIMNTTIDWKNNLRQKTRTEIGNLKAKALRDTWKNSRYIFFKKANAN